MIEDGVGKGDLEGCGVLEFSDEVVGVAISPVAAMRAEWTRASSASRASMSSRPVRGGRSSLGGPTAPRPPRRSYRTRRFYRSCAVPPPIGRILSTRGASRKADVRRSLRRGKGERACTRHPGPADRYTENSGGIPPQFHNAPLPNRSAGKHQAQ